MAQIFGPQGKWEWAASKAICQISTVGYNEFDFFLENEEYRPLVGCKIEI